ncbi:MAG: hypothetical protein IT462_11700 [Planctomycetes bacterium]|nr:hypothetical protein [Planctomycetota bacterium]
MARSTDVVAKIGEVFHQLNNDLNLVLGQLELCLRATKGTTEKLPQRLEALQRAAQRLADHVKEGQAISRKQRETTKEKNPDRPTPAN